MEKKCWCNIQFVKTQGYVKPSLAARSKVSVIGQLSKNGVFMSWSTGGGSGMES